MIHFVGSAFAAAGAHERGTAVKKILLPVESNTTFNAAFAVADLLGVRFASQIDGVALKPGVITFVTADPVVVLVSQPASTDAETEKSARALFDKLNAGRTPAGKAVFKWHDGGAIDDKFELVGIFFDQPPNDGRRVSGSLVPRAPARRLQRVGT